ASFWSFPLIQNKILNIHLGPLILALIVIILGRRIARFAAEKINRYIIGRLIKDRKTRNWLESTIGFLFQILILAAAFLIMGISTTVFVQIWKLNIFTVKENSVELGNIIVGLILLILGMGLTKYMSRQIVLLIPRRFRDDISVKKSLETIFRYLLVAFVFLFVLSVIGIPLTAFTVIGGAFAIGVGLGSQNLVNNFLSGLVLMMERPLKVGDIVEMENRRGTVEHIGGRSTRIKTFENYRMVIPNSKLLENSVVNWSLVDNFLRREVTVGVAYGSPVKKVHDLMIEAVAGNKNVEESPKPFVLFTDFGDNALIFRALFWVQLTDTVNPLIIESDIRFRIDELFRNAGVTIAFPQRDIHIDTLRPMEIRLVNPNNVESAAE
ncbi:MAG: mechanosensitive ion channel, partial [Candidatus Marinimicrobia bacterium]|nr:mechanosensitive ion channel [Candidatus Neomarinimicrobiota bacterium]